MPRTTQKWACTEMRRSVTLQHSSLPACESALAGDVNWLIKLRGRLPVLARTDWTRRTLPYGGRAMAGELQASKSGQGPRFTPLDAAAVSQGRF